MVIESGGLNQLSIQTEGTDGGELFGVEALLSAEKGLGVGLNNPDAKRVAITMEEITRLLVDAGKIGDEEAGKLADASI